MKVLFVACTDDPFDHNAGSGKDYELYHGLLQNQAEMVLAGPFPFTQTLVERVSRKLHGMLFKRRPVKYPASYLKHAARQVNELIRIHQPDVIFSKYLPIIARLKTSIPIVVLSDTTLAGSQREWPIFSELAYQRQFREEKKAYGMAAGIIVHSVWSVNDLVNTYRQPREKILMTACPASIPIEVIPETISKKELEPVKLLLVGRDRERKGVDIAIEVTRLMNQTGVKTELRIVGLSGDNDETVQYMGLFNKTIPQQLAAYAANYAWANFMIHPARFEAAGIAPSEAAAFGVPTITNDIGGLGTTVADGVSGIVLPRLSPPQLYAQSLLNYLSDPDQYEKLCRTTRERYDLELNWGVVSSKVYALCEKVSGQAIARTAIN